MALDNMNIIIKVDAIDCYSETLKKTENAQQRLVNNQKVATEKMRMNTQKLTHDTNKLNNSYDKMSSKIRNIAGAMFTLAGAKRAFQEYAYVEKYLTKTQAILHATGEEMQGMKDDLKELSQQSLTSYSEFAKATLVGASIKLNNAEMKAMLDTASKVKEGYKDVIDVEEISKMLAVMKKNFPDMEFDKMGDTLSWMLENVPNIDFLNLSNSLSKSSGMAKQLGLDVSEMLAVSSNEIVQQGGARADTLMRNVLRMMQKQGSKIAKTLGIQDFDMSKKGSFIEFITKLDEKYGKLSDSKRIAKFTQIFKNPEVAQAMNAYTFNLKDITKLYDDLQTKADGFADKTSKTIRAGSFATYTRTLNSLQNTFINIGQALAETGAPQRIEQLASSLEKMTSQLSKARDILNDIGSITETALISFVLGKFGGKAVQAVLSKTNPALTSKTLGQLMGQGTASRGVLNTGLKAAEKMFSFLSTKGGSLATGVAFNQANKLFNNLNTQPITQSVQQSNLDQNIEIILKNEGNKQVIDRVNMTRSGGVNVKSAMDFLNR